MSTVSKVEIERAWRRLVELSAALGAGSGEWVMAVPQQLDGARQLPWLVRNGRATVMVLGYTRRETLTALTCMNTVLAAIVAERV